MSKILRCLVCLLLICCMLVNLSPLKAKASAAGAVLGITKVASVSVPALWPIVAALAVVGVTAYGIESGAFENIANSCYSALESAGTWINNGMTEILRTEDADGNLQYYVDGAMISDVKNWLFSDTATASGPVVAPNPNYSPISSHGATTIRTSGYYFSGSNIAVLRYYSFSYDLDTSTAYSGGTYVINLTANEPLYYGSSSENLSSFTKYSLTRDGNRYYYFYSTFGSRCDYENIDSIRSSLSSEGFVEVPSTYLWTSSILDYLDNIDPFVSSYDLTLGYLPSEELDLDESTIVSFHPYLAELIQTKTGGSGGSGEDENKWWLAVAYAETLEKLYQTSQQAQIENPSVVEIPDLQEGTQYEVTVEEDEDGNKKYILNPIYDPGTNPGTGTDPGTGDGTDTDPDTGTDSGNGSGNTGTDSGSTGNTGSSWKPPSDHSQFALADLSKFFPFCIPFDLFDFFKLLNADPVAPSFTWEIQDLSGQTYGLTVDLSQWDSVAQLFRRLQLFLFVCGLAAASRKFIKW